MKMEQTMLSGIMIVSILCMCVAVINMIITITEQGKIKKTLREIADKMAAVQRLLDSEKRQGKADDALLSEIKGSVSSAIASQMEYEMKQIKQLLEEQSKMQSDFKQNLMQGSKENEKQGGAQDCMSESLQSTMIIPEISSEKAGTILCRSCYKPYPVTESKCPFCQARQNK